MDSVASRYAIALLSVAREENDIKGYVNEVEEIAKLLKANKELLILLKNYGLSLDEKKQVLKKCFDSRIKEYILNLFYVLIDNKRGGYILDVCNEFVRIGLNELNIKRGIVYTTIKLTSTQLTAIEKKVSKLLNANVTLTNIIDNSILGGLKVQVEDYILDDSIKNHLLKLKETITLKKGESN